MNTNLVKDNGIEAEQFIGVIDEIEFGAPQIEDVGGRNSRDCKV